MLSTLTYTDQQRPANRYRYRIISPSRAGDCCFSAMEWLDVPQVDVRWVYQDRRCRQCGFAVRVILREIPDTTLVASLPEALAHAFVRTVPESEWRPDPHRGTGTTNSGEGSPESERGVCADHSTRREGGAHPGMASIRNHAVVKLGESTTLDHMTG